MTLTETRMLRYVMYEYYAQRWKLCKIWGGGGGGLDLRFLGGMEECSPRIVIMPIRTIK